MNSENQTASNLLINRNELKEVIQIPVIIAGLGYFVDIYDLLLFGVVRIPSLQSLGLSGDELMNRGIALLNWQMFGLLIGGIIWGVLGDRKGRLSVLFGSILLYSIANIANGMVHTIPAYITFRFIAGVGLAGELGAGITLVSEILPARLRGFGTALVATLGMFGAVLAYFTANLFSWRIAFFVGGGLGLLLLIARIGVFESGLFNQIRTSSVERGNFLKLFTSWDRFSRFMQCVLIGLPLWYGIGILILLAPEFGKALGYDQPIIAGRAVMYSYIGLAIGDMGSGLLSQWMHSRKKVVLAFILFLAAMMLVYFFVPIRTASWFYFVCVILGIAVGYWALFVSIGAEQFGTNLRSTVTTSVPNFIRGTVPPITLAFQWVRGYSDIVTAALTVGFATIIIALLALRSMKESFGRDLNFLEKD